MDFIKKTTHQLRKPEIDVAAFNADLALTTQRCCELWNYFVNTSTAHGDDCCRAGVRAEFCARICALSSVHAYDCVHACSCVTCSFVSACVCVCVYVCMYVRMLVGVFVYGRMRVVRMCTLDCQSVRSSIA